MTVEGELYEREPIFTHPRTSAALALYLKGSLHFRVTEPQRAKNDGSSIGMIDCDCANHFLRICSSVTAGCILLWHLSLCTGVDQI